MLTVRQVLAMDPFANHSHLVAGADGLDNEVRWAHPVDIPQADEWVRAGELLLTTFYGLRDNAEAQIELSAQLAAKGLAGLIVAVGKYLDHVPPAIREAADAVGFPIIELEWLVPFEDVVRAVSEHIINEQYALYKQSLAIHRSLTRVVLDGGSLQDVATELCSLLRRPVEIDDLRFAVLAEASGSDTEIDESRRAAIREGHSSPQLLEHLRRSGVFARVRASLAPARIDVTSETCALGMTMARILTPIVVARKIHGYVWIIAGGRDLEPLDFHAIEHAATVTALILFRDQTVHQAEQRVESRVISRLLSENLTLDNTLREDAAQFRMRLEAPHAVVVADPGANDAHVLGMAARTAARYLGLPAAVGERAGRVVVLVECTRAQLVDDYCQRFLVETRLLDDPIHLGASARHNDAVTLHHAYEQALESLTLLPTLGGDRQVAHFDELGLLHWLHALPPDTFAENAYARHLQHLDEHDRTRGGELLHTLDVFLECDGNGVRAAERLIVHRHTLKYRLHRIEHICGVDLSDPFCKLNLRTALLSRRMRDGHRGD
jgi:purine catabolism regulator